MASPSPPSVLREFCPLYYLLNNIPAKISRGFRSVVVYLTALDVSSDFIAVGSSIGMLYLYCRRVAHMNKYSLEGKSDSITAVKLLSCFDDLVAVGTASGRVAIFQLVSALPGRNKQLRRFDVRGLHRGSVTCLTWSSNGMKLFSADDKGRVVFSALDLDQGVCNPVLLLEEPCGVVQLEYSHQLLLVSSQQRSLLYCTQTQTVHQLGSKPRKSSGRFGACFVPGLCKQSDVQVLACRPGLRLWRCDVTGQVEETRLLRPLFNTQFPLIELFPRSGPMGAYRPDDRQLGVVSCFHRDGWILSWNEYSIYVLDSLNQVIVGALESGGDIVCVSCCENEIFILKGDRDVIRLSTEPEKANTASLDDLSVRLSSPLATPTLLPATGAVETAQPIRTMAIVTEPTEVTDQLVGADRSRSSSVTSWDSHYGNGPVTPVTPSSGRYSAPIGREEMKQELVVKSIKVKKKKKRQSSGSANRLSESSCSSDAMFVVQDGSCSDAGSDITSVSGLDLQTRESPEQIQHTAEPGSLTLPSLDDPIPLTSSDPGHEIVPSTPDVDLLLECTFSYMTNTQQPMGEEEDESSPLIGLEEEEEEETGDLAPPCGVVNDHMFYSTVERHHHHSVSSDDEGGDIYHQTSDVITAAANHETADTHTDTQDRDTHTPDQLSESWTGYSGPGSGILNLQVTDRYVWCLDFKGGLYCSPLPDAGLTWQKFEDNVHQMALSPSGNLLWKVEQKSLTAFACAKVSSKGKRHWYKAVEQAAFITLSEDSAWIIRTNGDLYLQTGLSVERPCARCVKVDSPCLLTQVCVSSGVVWALSEHKALFYREGVNAFCSEGEGWKYDTVSEAQGVELMCVALGDSGTAWALDAGGSLWFRTGISPDKPNGTDDHWWQISISDYVVFDQGNLFQTLLAATQSVATVTVAFLSQFCAVQPSLISANASGVWVASGRNQLHRARGRLVGTFWQNVVPRGTVSSTRWSFITSSAIQGREGTFLWLAQSRKDLFCVWDQDGELRPSSVSLPPEVELTHLSACPDALWALDTHGRVTIRTLSPSCPIGMTWTPLDLSQLGNVRLVSVSCGCQNVWAVDTRGIVYFRVGTQPFNPSMMLPAWIHIEPPRQPIGVQLVAIETSPNDRLLWALDNRGSVFVRTGLSEEMPVGTDWELVPGLSVSQLSLSCRTVWVRCVNGDVARRYGNNERNAAGDYWKKIPGHAHWLTVTPDDDLWAVTLIGGLSRRLTKLLPQTRLSPASLAPAPSMDDPEEEWELI